MTTQVKHPGIVSKR